MVGGTGVNAAAAAARLGSSVSLVAVVGDDPSGTWLRDKITIQGIEVCGITVAAFDNVLSKQVVVVETRSEHGSVIHQLDGSIETIDAFDVDAVDTTGAGDCFAGALCHYLLDGRTIGEACVLASIAAGLSTRAFGAQSALPTTATVQLARSTRTN